MRQNDVLEAAGHVPADDVAAQACVVAGEAFVQPRATDAVKQQVVRRLGEEQAGPQLAEDGRQGPPADVQELMHDVPVHEGAVDVEEGGRRGHQRVPTAVGTGPPRASTRD